LRFPVLSQITYGLSFHSTFPYVQSFGREDTGFLCLVILYTTISFFKIPLVL
jgi:hypothetical protein